MKFIYFSLSILAALPGISAIELGDVKSIEHIKSSSAIVDALWLPESNMFLVSSQGTNPEVLIYDTRLPTRWRLWKRQIFKSFAPTFLRMRDAVFAFKPYDPLTKSASLFRLNDDASFQLVHNFAQDIKNIAATAQSNFIATIDYAESANIPFAIPRLKLFNVTKKVKDLVVARQGNAIGFVNLNLGPLSRASRAAIVGSVSSLTMSPLARTEALPGNRLMGFVHTTTRSRTLHLWYFPSIETDFNNGKGHITIPINGDFEGLEFSPTNFGVLALTNRRLGQVLVIKLDVLGKKLVSSQLLQTEMPDNNFFAAKFGKDDAIVAAVNKSIYLFDKDKNGKYEKTDLQIASLTNDEKFSNIFVDKNEFTGVGTKGSVQLATLSKRIPSPIAPIKIPALPPEKPAIEEPSRKDSPSGKTIATTTTAKRMLILLDKDEEGPLDSEQLALTSSFAVAIHSKATPILASWSVVNNFLERKYNKNVKQGDWDKEFFARANFALKDFRIYHVINSQFFLFVPHAMTWVEGAEAQTIDRKLFSLPSIKLSTLVLFTGATIQGLRDWVARKYNAKQEIDVSRLANIFFRTSDISSSRILSQAFSNLPRDERANLISAQTRPWNFLVEGHGSFGDDPYIAGLSAENFQELLIMFNQMHTQVVAISSCYAGGKNLDFAQFKNIRQRYIADSRLRYILGVISSSDTPSASYYQMIGNDKDAYYSVAKFFEALEKQVGPNWLSNAFRYVARKDQDEAPENIPQILIPNLDWVQAYRTIATKDDPSSSPIMVLTNVLNRKHQIERSPIIIGTHVKSLLIYPKIIPSTIMFEQSAEFPAVVSMERGDASHVIKSVELAEGSKGLQQFLRDAFLQLRGNMAKKLFYIQSLTGNNDFESIENSKGVKLNFREKRLTLNDVVIYVYVDDDDKEQIILIFTMKDRIWGFVFAGEQPEDKNRPIPITEYPKVFQEKALKELVPELPELIKELEN